MTPEDPSILGQRVRLTAVLRTGSHLALGLLAVERGRARAWLAATAAAVMVDRAVVQSLQRCRGPRPSWHSAVETLDAGLWSLSGADSPTSVRHVYVANGVAGAVEAGYLLGAGTTAMPVPEVAAPFPPGPIGRWWPTVGRAALPIMGPVLAQRLVRRRRGQRTSLLDELYGPISFGMGLLLARTRHRLQADAVRRWDARADYQASVERQAVRASLYTRNNDAHAFRKNLVPLYLAGSQEAAACLLEAQQLPTVVLASDLGTTLHDAVLGVPLDPPSSGTTWLSPSQRDDVRQFVDVAEAAPRSDGDNIRVDREPNAVRLSYLGHEHRVESEPPRLGTVIDPVPAALAMAALWKLLATADYLGGVAPAVAIGTSLLDGAAAATYYARRERSDKPPVAVLGLSVVSSVLFSAAVASGRARANLPDGTAIFPATGAVNGCTLVLIRYWGSLSWIQRASLFGPVLVGWLAAALIPARRSLLQLLIELVSPAQSCLATYGIGQRISWESDLLDTTLQERFAQQVADERQRQAEDFLDYYDDMIRLIERELVRLRSVVPGDIAASMDAECATMRRWVTASRAEPGLGWL